MNIESTREQPLINKIKIALNNELAIKYTIQKEYIDKTVFGIDSITQLKRNLSIFKDYQAIPDFKIEQINVLENELLNPTNW